MKKQTMIVLIAFAVVALAHAHEIRELGWKDLEVKVEFDDPFAKLDQGMTPRDQWQWITRNLLRPEHPMEVHELLHRAIFADGHSLEEPISQEQATIEK